MASDDRSDDRADDRTDEVSPSTELWQLLDLAEDWARGGMPRVHRPPPPNLGNPAQTGRSSAETGQPTAGRGRAAEAIRSGYEDIQRSAVVPGSSSAAGATTPPGYAEAGSSGDPATTLQAVATEVDVCTSCRLCESRTRTVPGEGTLTPQIMVIGEGPGRDEDRSGRPFVGRAGQYLDRWLEAIDSSRETNAFIANVVKCRPPDNRDPAPDETAACLPYLRRQIETLRPAFILSVGRIASQVICDSSDGIGRLRGRTYRFDGIPVIPTYHPSGVLRNPSFRQAVWDDLRRLKAELGGSG